MEIAQRFDALAANVRAGREMFSGTKQYEDISPAAWRLLGRSERTYGEVATLVGEACGSIGVAALHERGSGWAPDPGLAGEFAQLDDWICPQAPDAPGLSCLLDDHSAKRLSRRNRGIPARERRHF